MKNLRLLSMVLMASNLCADDLSNPYGNEFLDMPQDFFKNEQAPPPNTSLKNIQPHISSPSPSNIGNIGEFPQDRFVTASDHRINMDIRNKIYNQARDGFVHVILRTANGTVTLSGYVDSAAAKEKLMEAIHGIDGVNGIAGDVQIKTK